MTLMTIWRISDTDPSLWHIEDKRMCHRPLKLRADGSYAQVHELGSIDLGADRPRDLRD